MKLKTDDDVRRAGAKLLMKLESVTLAQHVGVLVEMTQSVHEGVRSAAAQAIEKLDPPILEKHYSQWFILWLTMQWLLEPKSNLGAMRC